MAAAVRRIAPGEGQLLREVRLAALCDAPDAFASGFDEESRWPARVWETKAAERASGCADANFVAESEGRVVGLVGAYRSEAEPQTVELVSMWVAPEARGAGIGAQLVEKVVEWATVTGAARVALWVVRGNEPATVLYERAGFVRTGDTDVLASNPCHEELRMVRVLA